MTSPGVSDGESAGTLRVARFFAAGTTAGLLGLTALSELVPGFTGLGSLVGPVSLLCLVSPVIGFRLHIWLRERLPATATVAERRRAFLLAHVLPLSVTESMGLLGVVTHVFSGELFPLVGVVTHVILAGAIWPSEERLARFLEPA